MSNHSINENTTDHFDQEQHTKRWSAVLKHFNMTFW